MNALARRAAPLLALALAAALAVACEDGGGGAPPDTLGDRLVTTTWLSEHLGDQGLVVVDARSTYAYLDRHLPGAVSASFPEGDALSHGRQVSYGGGIDLFLDVDRDIPFQDDGPAKVQAAIRAMGISDGSTVVVYDDGIHFHAARFFFTLASAGHRDVRILDGGLLKWEADGGGTTVDLPAVEPGDFTARPAGDAWVADTDDVLDALVDPTQRVVTGLYASWHFAQVLPYDRPGHIPGAIMVPIDLYFHADGTWRSKDELTHLFGAFGVTVDQDVITYCGGNPLSAATWFTLRHVMEHPGVRNYTGSLLAWLADPRGLPLDVWQHPRLLRDTDHVHWWAGERIQTLLRDAPSLVLDVRSPGDYAAGHIPYSVNLPDPDPTSRAAATWASDLGAAGVSAATEIIVCDHGVTPRAAGLFWLLEALGHPKAALCADGVAGWEARGYAPSTEATLVTAPTGPLDASVHPKVFEASLRGDLLARTLSDEPADPWFARLWIDAGAAPSGDLGLTHVAHVPWEANLTEAGRMRPAGELWALYEAAGVTMVTEVVLYAPDVREAAVGYLALRLLGLPMVRVYVPGGAAL